MDAPDARDLRTSRALRAFAPVLLGVGTLFAVSQYSGVFAEKPFWQQVFESFAFLPLQLGSSLALLVASRRAALPDGVQRALRYSAAAFAFVAAGSLIWAAYYLRFGSSLPYISWLDAVYFPFYPLLTLSMLALPGEERPRRGVPYWVGLTVVTAAFGGLTVFGLAVDPDLRSVTPTLRALMVLTSATQLVALFAANGAVERARRIPSARAILLLAGALGLAVVGDLVFQLVYAVGYDGPNVNIAVAILVNLMIYRAAIAFLEDPVQEPGTDTPMLPYSPLPIVAVTAVALMLVWMSSTGRGSGTVGLLVALVLLNVMLVVRDVLTARAAAAAMQAGVKERAERRLEALVRHASDAILLVDQRGSLAFASAPADRLFGTSLSSREGIPFRDLIPFEGREEWDAFLAFLRASPGRPATHLWRFPEADGKVRTLECIGLDLRDEPAVGGTVLNLRDVTERQALEDRLRQAQKLEVAGRLAGGVAHDFNNVLTAVIAGTELAQLSLEEEHPLQSDLAGIGAAAQRGAALTRRLLAFVRHEPVPAQRIDVEESLRDLEPLLARLAGESHQVVLSAAPGLGTIEVDRNELEHIVFNLVANARDAMTSGGRIVISVEPVTLSESPHDEAFIIRPPAGTFAAITVADTGIGMAHDVRRRMFDPFFTQKSGGRGTGLGLIGVQPLIDGARGGVRVTSAPGAGTAVTLFLPLVGGGATTPRRSGGTRAASVSGATGDTDPGPRPTTPRDTPTVSGTGPRILLVEDEPDVREQLARLLEALGYTAIAVPSAADARAVLARPAHGIVAVVSDVMMPGETGIDFAAWLRTEHASVPIMLISGHTGTALDLESRGSAHLPLLRKPFGRAELDERLRELLGT